MKLLSLLTGSRSSDFEQLSNLSCPLPPCSGSPNCVRLSRDFPRKTVLVWNAALAAVEQMNPQHMKADHNLLKITSVFQVLIFKDDFCLQLEDHSQGTYVHIRSASRYGRYDLGVNRRRVKRFLKLLNNEIREG